MESISDTDGIMGLSIALLLWKRNGSNGQHKSSKTTQFLFPYIKSESI